MAASMMSWRLSVILGCGKSSGFQQLDVFARVLIQPEPVQLCFTRGARRTCKQPAWASKRNVDFKLHEEVLTKDSKQYLQDVAIERFKERMANSPLKSTPTERHQWTPKTMRTGVLAIKIGVIPQWTKDGHRFTCTLLQVLDNHVVRYVPPEEFEKYPSFKKNWRKNIFGSLVVGALSTDPFRFSKKYNNLCAKAGLPPKRKLTRFLVTPDAAIEPGTPLKATHFRVGDYVDCQAKTIGHGFQGVVKRWGFRGGPASHGTTKWHRRTGNIGGGRNKAAVWKGRKMPGHMGMEWRTLRGLKIWRINTKYNILYVMGQSVPGPVHCYVRVMDSRILFRRRERAQRPPYMPTFFPEDVDEPLPEEIFDEELFKFTEPTITFSDEKNSSGHEK